MPGLRETSALHSPLEGILEPNRVASLRKKHAGLCSVVAVRTFPDDQAPKQPAGSVWLSSEAAEAANIKRGRMLLFREHDNIFDNIEEAKLWIENQVNEPTTDDELVAEAEQLYKEAVDRAVNKRKQKQVAKKKSQPPAKNSKGGGRGRGKGRGKGRGRGRG